ncbi:MAG: hypothetical protein KDA92_11485 [Planctomycetales bacterium]|nr:hypothetical protein [Planctomycetales bacterium]MCA9169598.1 hypothetical protein [Planctomycetales bacterium]
MSNIKPLNIWSNSDEEIGRLMSHFAHTPFVLDRVEYGSVEAFYTWLLIVNNDSKRARVAPMWGARAKHACPKQKPDCFEYQGRKIRRYSAEHVELITRANRAKLDAHPGIARAFIETRPRPITHEIRGSNADPFAVFCPMMCRLRDEYVVRLNVTEDR